MPEAGHGNLSFENAINPCLDCLAARPGDALEPIADRLNRLGRKALLFGGVLLVSVAMQRRTSHQVATSYPVS